ncbi:hypothetical protein [Longimicrobium sp.]|jgi:hypothetical protein|uniref:hypothetical protein n=1 Tax=Longimicrobium sp. TaxID=2029185 RepID=UPI002F951616
MQHSEDEGRETDGGKRRPMLAGVEVREEDLEPTKGLEVATVVVRVAAAVVLLLALFQFGYWWFDRPPGGVGMGLLIGDTIRLIVFAALLWAGADLAGVMIKTHYDIRASRILMARQTYMMKQMGVAKGALPPEEAGHRRADDAD